MKEKNCYGINESTVRTVKKRKENIRNSVVSGTLSQCSLYIRNLCNRKYGESINDLDKGQHTKKKKYPWAV